MFKIQTYISVTLLLVLSFTVFSSSHAETLSSKAKGLFFCSGFYYILAADTPNILIHDRKALELRDFYADMGKMVLESENGKALSDKEVNSTLSHAMESIESLHKRNKKKAVADVLSYCLAWQDNIVEFFRTVSIEKLNAANTKQLKRYLENLQDPTNDHMERSRNYMDQADFNKAMESLNLWADRGYINPRKAKEMFGLGN